MKRVAASSGGLVYSTEAGRMCPACRRPLASCSCGTPPARPAGDGIVRVSRETHGRKGKGVTLVKGLPLDDAALLELGKTLKTLCGSGGSVKDGVIEIQGDHVDKLIAHLMQAGHRVKRAGG
jgi:translation initiation factor 1